MSNGIPFLISFNPFPYSHYPPPLPTFIHPPPQLWKLCKILWKTFSLAYKYPINQRKIPVNSSKSYLDTPLFFLFLVFKSVVLLIYWEPMVPRPSFPEKTFSLFSSSPHFVRVAVKPFFIYRTFGSQMKKPTSSYRHFFEKVLE